MRNRKIDLALTIPQFVPAGLHSRRLFRERYVGVVRQKHPLAKGNVDVQRFVAFPHLLVSPDKGDFNGPTDAALDKIGLKRNIALVVPSFSVVAAIIERAIAVFAVSSRASGNHGHSQAAPRTPLESPWTGGRRRVTTRSEKTYRVHRRGTRS